MRDINNKTQAIDLVGIFPLFNRSQYRRTATFEKLKIQCFYQKIMIPVPKNTLFPNLKPFRPEP
jgi:hypothetical protein